MTQGNTKLLPFVKGDTWKNKGDDYTTYSIDGPHCVESGRYHYSKIMVCGDKDLRNRIIELLNEVKK